MNEASRVKPGKLVSTGVLCTQKEMLTFPRMSLRTLQREQVGQLGS